MTDAYNQWHTIINFCCGAVSICGEENILIKHNIYTAFKNNQQYFETYTNRKIKSNIMK